MSDFAEKVEEKVAVGAEEGDENDNEPVPEEESTATFAPVVQLEAIEVKSLEEDEDIVYHKRAKLFIFGETLLDKGTGNKSWRERGVGVVKLLRHRETNRIRVLMRQEKTMKLIVNHFLDPRISLTPNAGSDKSWVWIAFDFAENELIETTFAVRFSDAAIANEFKAAFLEAQQEMTRWVEGQDSKEGAQEADEAVAALAGLSVQSGEETEQAAEPVAESAESSEEPEATA